MLNVLENGKYKPRKEWNTSIPSLVDIQEHHSDEENVSPSSHNQTQELDENNTKKYGLPPKPPRRSSLAMGLLAGRGFTDKGNKRRSSITVAFLGRRESNKIPKETSSFYESIVKSEKSDGSTTNDPNIIFTSQIDDGSINSLDDSNDGGSNTSSSNIETIAPTSTKSIIRFFEDNKNSQNQMKKKQNKITFNENGSTGTTGVGLMGGGTAYEKEANKINKNKGRRSSWQAKLERRRRKSHSKSFSGPTLQSVVGGDNDGNEMTGDDIRKFLENQRNSNGDVSSSTIDENEEIINFSRQKRHSWWNIFVPDMKNRSRRASQDVNLMTRSADSLSPPIRRSKSRSVDHGLAAPFDLDSLRSKVEGRFESVDRLTKDGDKLKKSSLPSIPTTNYTVGNRDTLTSVAARFDTTPSELMHLNKLASNFIYSGQQLLVPDKTAQQDTSSTTGSTSDDKISSTTSGKSSPIDRSVSQDTTNEEKDILDGLRPGSPKPGHIERVNTEGKDGDDPVITQRFLKINVRHITDGQGVVGGVLLVTPNAVMFDPNVSDTLVIEHGPESYGVIAPMELVVNAAIFHDIAHMRVAGTGGNVGGGGSGGIESSTNEKVEVYYPKPKEIPRLEGTQTPEKDPLLVKDDTFPELGGVGLSSVETCDDQESIASSGRDGNAFPKAFEKDRVTPVSDNSTDKQDKKSESETKESAKTDNEQGEKREEIEIRQEKSKSEGDNNDIKKDELTDTRSTLEERRKSLLDHHWAIPSKDRISLNNSRRSSEDEGDIFNRRNSNASSNLNNSFNNNNSISTISQRNSITEKNDAELAAAVTESLLKLNNERRYSSGFPLLDSLSGLTSQSSRSNSISGTTGLIGNNNINGKLNHIATTTATAATINLNNSQNQNNFNNIMNSTINNISAGLDFDTDNDLSLQSYYDSGIDIRDPIPVVAPMPTKKVFSDADIVLSSDWVPPRTISPTPIGESSPKPSTTNLSQTQSLDTPHAGGTSPGGGTAGRKKTSSVSFSVDENIEKEKPEIVTEKSVDQNKKNKMLKRLSYPLTWVEGLTGDGQTKPNDSLESAPNTGDSNQSVFSKVFSSSPITLVSELGGNLFSKTPSEDSGGSPVPPVTPHSEGHSTPGRSSIGTFMRPSSTDGITPSTNKKSQPPQPKLDYRSMVSIDDMPELFVSFDKLIPRPARACQDPPLYLRLRMGKPIGKAIPLPTSVMSYGKNKLRPEYWFSVPKNRVDELYRFINTWVPHLYGELNEDEIKVRGFELIQHDTEWTKHNAAKEGRKNSDGEDITELTRESWELLKAPFVKSYNISKDFIKTAGEQDLDFLGSEVLSMSTDDYRKASLFATNSFDLDFPVPDLIGTTEILTEEHREKLCSHLPARAEGYSWSLVFSTSQHGFSLNSLYRKMQRLESPVLIVIEDTEHNVFGALTSCALHVSDHFYGTGESLLYKFNPSFKVFHWTGENLYFIKGNPESLSIGAGDGKFGLWLDGDLNQGRSQTCSTYGNETLAPQEDFVIKTLECWAFV